jgi:hypothetical protein
LKKLYYICPIINNSKHKTMQTFRLTILDYKRETLFFMNINADGYLEASKKARRTLETTNDNRAFTFELEQLTF